MDHCHSAKRAQQMHSPPSLPSKRKLCFTSTQTQLLSVITSILGCLSGGWITKAAKHGLNCSSSWWEERGPLNRLSHSIGLMSLKVVVWMVVCGFIGGQFEQVSHCFFTHRTQEHLHRQALTDIRKVQRSAKVAKPWRDKPWRCNVCQKQFYVLLISAVY